MHRLIDASTCRLIGLSVMCGVLSGACGKVGPPLAPLRLMPAAVTDVVARRAGNEVRFTFVLPVRNENGPGPIDLGRVEVYAGTVAAGAVNPPNRELFVPGNLIATIDVKQPVPEGTSELPARPNDIRPSAGETTTFVEELNAAKLTPVFTTVAPPVLQAPVIATTATTATTATVVPTTPVEPPLPPLATRIYGIRGATRGGRPGSPAARITIPLVDPPPAPTGVIARVTETGIVLSWTPPAGAIVPGATLPTASPVGFNVYRSLDREDPAPLNAAPIVAAPFERVGVTFGQEECFVVRSVMMARGATIESAPSERVCTTPADTFAPAEPKSLQAVASTGAISLIWDANTDSDLGGYLVLRGVAPGDTLQALTPAPIRDTTFRDTTTKPGVRYVYAIVAVDRATPPNVSGQSNRAEETAR
ncbi:MAG TPA: hypothetical protein VNJ03_04905 [Vicinamibacterales bacterium]|nr:hypothetical protein [Vicinamibacterales bacterium]